MPELGWCWLGSCLYEGTPPHRSCVGTSQECVNDGPMPMPSIEGGGPADMVPFVCR